MVVLWLLFLFFVLSRVGSVRMKAFLFLFLFCSNSNGELYSNFFERGSFGAIRMGFLFWLFCSNSNGSPYGSQAFAMALQWLSDGVLRLALRLAFAMAWLCDGVAVAFAIGFAMAWLLQWLCNRLCDVSAIGFCDGSASNGLRLALLRWL